MRTKMVVCNVYKLFKDGKNYTKQGKVIKRNNLALTRDYVEEKNNNWTNVGLWHEIDEDATVHFYEERELRRKEKKAAAKVSGHLNEVLVDVIKKGANIESIEVESEDVTELEDLKKQYKEKFDKKPFHSWGVAKLKEKLA